MNTKVGFTLGEMMASGAIGAAGGAASDPDHRARNAALGGLAGATTGMIGLGLTPDKLWGSPVARAGMMTAGALAPAALMYATRDKESHVNHARQYGAKLAALDTSKLPQGVSLPSPYEAQWRTPSGHGIKHPVKNEVVDHGAATNPAYYDELSKEIGKRTDLAEQQAPGDIAFEAKSRRFGNGFTGAALGGLAGAGVGAAVPVKPLDHMEYGDDETGAGVPGGPISHLYQESPEERRMKALQQQMEDTRSDMDDMRYDPYGYHGRRPYGRY